MKQQFPYYNELQAIFAARMQRMLWNEAEGSGAGGSKKKATQLSSDDEDENEESDGEQRGTTSGKKKRKVKQNPGSSNAIGGNVNANVGGLKEMWEDFMRQQGEMEMRWLKTYEAREEERRMREMEWRQRMEELEKERIMMERRWREREEQRSAREEARAEKRDALINALLIKLRREDKS